MNPYNIGSPIATDHLARPFFSGPNVKRKKSGLGCETTSNVVHNEDWGGITSVELPLVLQTKWTNYRYFPIDEEWQIQACRLLNL